MKFSKLFLGLALMVLLTAISAVAAQTDEALPDLGGRTITVAVENAYPPFNSINQETGEAEGWDYDVVAEICVRLNCVPEFVETSWDGMILAVSGGEFDMAADGITISEDRKEIVDFSDGYIRTSQRLLARIDETRFTDFESFAAIDGLLVGTQPGTTNYALAESLLGGEERLVGYDTFGVAVQALIAGDVDVVFMDEVAGQGYVGLNAESVVVIGDALTSDELGFIFPKESELVAAVNAALADMTADRTLEIINGKWFPQQMPDLGGRVIKIAVENAYAPFNYIDEVTGEAVGWDYDTLNEACVRLNCVPEYITTSWDGMILAVSNGEYDLAADGISITLDRAEIVDYSIPLISTDQVLLVRIDEERFSSFATFAEDDSLLIGTQPGTTNYELAANLLDGEDRIVAYDTFGITVQALIAGDIDAVILDNVAGLGYVGTNKEDVKIVGNKLQSDKLAFIYPRGSDIVDAFDIALISMLADGTIAASNDLWFNAGE
ncbi:MAG: amino acid ABC transporter substrate-binding protein [Armatimonadetes bacterium]|nr:amino acid ABC transporter substrate-binding protein [Anaerolineae bacterium]